MAPPLVVSNAVQVRLGWDLNTELAFNVLNFQATAGVLVGNALADQVGTQIKQSFLAQWAPKCSTSTRLVRIGVRDLRQPNQPEYLDNQPAEVGIVTPNDPLPRAAAVCVTLRTAGAGKSFRGRVYLPGVAETSNTNSAQDGALGLSAAAFINDIVTRLQPLNMILGVLSRPSDDIVLRQITSRGGVELEDRVLSHTTEKTGQITPVVLVESRNSRWEYQRRRDNGRGQGVSSLFSVAKFTIEP